MVNKMGISQETRIINFLISSLKKHGYLERGIIEYKIPLPSGNSTRPDFLAYLINPKKPNQKNYLAFEIKLRSLNSKDGSIKTSLGTDDICRIKDQYARLSSLTPNSFDQIVIPKNIKAPIYFDYIFYNTSTLVLDEINKNVNFKANDAILYYFKKKGTQERFHYYQKPNLNLHNELTDILINDSKIARYWSNFFVPFLLKDIEGIKGLGGDPLDVAVDPAISANIVLAQLFSFIEQKKVRDEESELDVEDFFDFVFSHLKGLVRIDDEERTAIIKKLRNLLNHIVKICNDSNLTLIDTKTVNKYQIKVRKTENITTRLENLQSKVLKLIDDARKQLKLDKFF